MLPETKTPYLVTCGDENAKIEFLWCKTKTHAYLKACGDVDAKTEFLWCKTKTHAYVVTCGDNSSPFVDDALAIRAALTQAACEEIRIFSVKSESLQLVRAINSGSKVSKLHGTVHDFILQV